MRPRVGFTLVELLVVIAIIGILVAILLPAVQAAREAARKKHCMNNVRQMAIAFLNHDSVHHFLPSGGWAHDWIGEPDVGYDEYQPGSWAYNILSYLEQDELRELGSGMSILDPAREPLLIRLVSTPVPVFNCPSRRPSGPFTYRHASLANNLRSCSMSAGCRVVRGDYRANTGNFARFGGGGPALYIPIDGVVDKNQWKALYKKDMKKEDHNGICYGFSTIRLADITDGAAHTAMLGEKLLNPLYYVDEGTPPDYENGEAADDDQCLYSGFDRDNNGLTGEGYLDAFPPHTDDPTYFSTDYRFGSAHPDGFHMAFCDGSVRFLDYEINGRVFLKMGGRNDD